MKLVSYRRNYIERAGIYNEGLVYDLQDSAQRLSRDLPMTIGSILKGGSQLMEVVRGVHRAVLEGRFDPVVTSGPLEMLAPVPHPTSCRDGYAFRQHVESARRNRGVEMIPEFDNFPVFYFTNHNAVFGEGDICVEVDHLNKLDFELEAAVVIGIGGKNIPVHKADEHIAGYTIMNDFSARALQMDEMKLNLGPAKGKDFATAIGPWLVTPDELEPYLISTPRGNKYDLAMTAFHNGRQVSAGNMKDMTFTFAEIISRASYGVNLCAGDVIGSGTVGTGCYLELNGTGARLAKEKGTQFTPVWLNEGDHIELRIQGLGRLSNHIVKSSGSRPISGGEE